MPWVSMVFVIPLSIIFVISLLLAYTAWSNRPSAGAEAFALFMLAVAGWTGLYTLELGTAFIEMKLLWHKIKYLFIVIVSPATLIFALQYTARERWLTRQNIVLLLVIPAMSLALFWTNSRHLLFFVDIEVVQSSPFSVINATYGPAFWLHAAYSYLLFIIGIGILLYEYKANPQAQSRQQIIVVVIAGLAPWVGNVITILELIPLGHLDLTPFMFTVTGIALAWGLLRYQLLDILPVAQTAIIRSMQDGYLVLNTDNCVVDVNPAAQRMLGSLRGDLQGTNLIGLCAVQIFENWPNLTACLYSHSKEYNTLIQSSNNRAKRFFDVSISPLHDEAFHFAGRLVMMHDSSEREQANQALRQRRQQLRNMMEQMQQVEKLRSEYIAHISNELRAPLTNIQFYIGLLERCANSEQNRYFEVLNKETQTLKKLLENASDMSQMETLQKSKRIHPKAQNMDDAIQMCNTADITPHCTEQPQANSPEQEETVYSHSA
ncbi:PAS domain-containing protein [Chloroflexi bacterium TSY]|nr:PAS domain-containing protein [Chloroflexi bacterium TSY]